MRVPLVLRKLFRRRIVLMAAVLLALVAMVALFAGPLSGLDPNETAVSQRLAWPSIAHWLGTDELGRDLFARIAFGGRTSLAIAALTALGAIAAGTSIGLIAGFFRHLDAPLMRVVDAMMSFPDILLAIALVGILGSSMLNVVFALVLVYTPRVARVVRASTLVVRELAFVEAARAVGVPTPRILWRHILPNLVSPITVQGTFIFAYAILAEAALSFLGVGRAAGDPHLGHDGRGQPAVRAPGDVDRVVPGTGDHRHGAVVAAAGRRHPRSVGPATAQVDVRPRMNRLDIRGLSTSFATDEGLVQAVVDVSFSVGAGRTTALVGESGSGKSVTSLTVMRLLPRTAHTRVSGSVQFVDRAGRTLDLLSLPEPAMRAIRGNEIAMIFQEPMTSLNPVFAIGEQIAESLRLHKGLDGAAARAQALRMLELVEIPAATQRLREYPHQLSGGMRQRVMIALAMACGPTLLIADEPTTALDVTIQAQILALMRRLQAETGMSILFITHNLGVVAHHADDVVVMYAGRIVETAPVAGLFAQPRHPYTQGAARLPAEPPAPAGAACARQGVGWSRSAARCRVRWRRRRAAPSSLAAITRWPPAATRCPRCAPPTPAAARAASWCRKPRHEPPPGPCSRHLRGP